MEVRQCKARVGVPAIVGHASFAGLDFYLGGQIGSLGGEMGVLLGPELVGKPAWRYLHVCIR